MGTIDMYAAMDLGTGKVITSLSSTHTTQDFLLSANAGRPETTANGHERMAAG
jgi:hypothetical protein